VNDCAALRDIRAEFAHEATVSRRALPERSMSSTMTMVNFALVDVAKHALSSSRLRPANLFGGESFTHAEGDRNAAGRRRDNRDFRQTVVRCPNSGKGARQATAHFRQSRNSERRAASGSSGVKRPFG